MNNKVTDSIREDIRHQLYTSNELPFRLTLASIADYYAVSVTPVREVVEQLVSDALLLRKSNGRLERAKITLTNVSDKTSQPAQKPLLGSGKLDELVTQDVVRLCLQNYSDYLREEASAKKYHAGRTVIRQVFSRLAGSGLLEHVPRCGWKVRSFRQKDLFDYLEIRELLEIKALRLARPAFNNAELEQLLAGNITQDASGGSTLDNDLHHYWLERCDNWYIQDFFRRHSAFYNVLFDYAALGEHIKTAMAQEHRDILQALIAGNWQAAETALVKHIRDQKNNVLQLIKLVEQNRNL